MADISQIKIPNIEQPYDVKDASAQSRLDTVESDITAVEGRLTTIEGKEAGWDAKAETSDVSSAISTHNSANDAHTDIRNAIPSVTDNVTSTSTTSALSAKQGKLLNDRIDNLSLIGRFLALWDCTTGMPLSNPSGYPYAYHTGDYFRINKVAAEGGVNYMPNGSSYQGTPSTTVYDGEVAATDIWFYDGTTWTLQINHATSGGGGGLIDDVKIDGESVVVDRIADISLDDFAQDATHRLVSDTEKNNWNAKGTYSKPSGGIPESDLSSSVQASLDLADSSIQSHQSAIDVNGASVGSATKGTYIDSNGKPTAMTYSLNKDVPSDAKFTDTTYSDATTSEAGLMSTTDKSKLDGIAAGAQVNVKPDWNASAGAANEILNKPSIPDMSNVEVKANMTQTISSGSTATQYPSAKAVYDSYIAVLGNIESALSVL